MSISVPQNSHNFVSPSSSFLSILVKSLGPTNQFVSYLASNKHKCTTLINSSYLRISLHNNSSFVLVI